MRGGNLEISIGIASDNMCVRLSRRPPPTVLKLVSNSTLVQLIHTRFPMGAGQADSGQKLIAMVQVKSVSLDNHPHLVQLKDVNHQQ